MTFAAVMLAACVAVSPVSDRIVAGDLAATSPAFAALDPDTMIGWAPAPGVRRDFPVAELHRSASGSAGSAGSGVVRGTESGAARSGPPSGGHTISSARRPGTARGFQPGSGARRRTR